MRPGVGPVWIAPPASIAVWCGGELSVEDRASLHILGRDSTSLNEGAGPLSSFLDEYFCPFGTTSAARLGRHCAAKRGASASAATSQRPINARQFVTALHFVTNNAFLAICELFVFGRLVRAEIGASKPGSPPDGGSGAEHVGQAGDHGVRRGALTLDLDRVELAAEQGLKP